MAVDSNAPPPPAVTVENSEDAPVKKIDPVQLGRLGENLARTFEQYASDRKVVEQRWLRNVRQYLGIYDPEIEKELGTRSKAYPRVTRVKCISVLSRIMNLMFPGNERNWELKASPNADMKPEDVLEAMRASVKRYEAEGAEPTIDAQFVRNAVQTLAADRAKLLSTIIDDQLQELGGDQTLDYIALNRKVVYSGILYGLGLLRGPFVRTENVTTWDITPDGQPVMRQITQYKPMFEFLPIWDYYPDMSAKTLAQGDGDFIRLVMSKQQFRDLAKRADFFEDQVKAFIRENPQGNFKSQNYESELRSMGVKTNVSEQKSQNGKFEVLIWNGPIDAQMLIDAGCEVPDEKRSDMLDAEVWIAGNKVIKCMLNQWAALGVRVRTTHAFVFDEDDTSPVGNGLPYVVRDSQMSICAATRMALDNAGVICGPNMELNLDLLVPNQDLTAVEAYKFWYREGTGVDAQFPAVRNLQIDSHLDELMKLIDLFMKFADMETFVGPATGGDMDRGPSEPFRTAAGASMLRGEAALPFKDIIRNFDSFTQSVIYSIVQFNRKFNPGAATEGDFNVIARGATSLIAKEIRGVQLDGLSATLTPEERQHIDERRLLEARFGTRDALDVLLSPEDAARKKAGASQAAAAQQQLQEEAVRAEIRKTLSDAFKNIAQGQKNAANADAVKIKAAIDLLVEGLDDPTDTTGKDNGAAAPSKPAKAKA